MSSDDPEDTDPVDDHDPAFDVIGDPAQNTPVAVRVRLHDLETTFTEKTTDQKREDIRGWLALSLVGILAAEIGASLLAMLICPNSVSSVKELLSVILGPTAALVGSATGFYFGYKESSARRPK